MQQTVPNQEDQFSRSEVWVAAEVVVAPVDLEALEVLVAQAAAEVEAAAEVTMASRLQSRKTGRPTARKSRLALW